MNSPHVATLLPAGLQSGGRSGGKTPSSRGLLSRLRSPNGAVSGFGRPGASDTVVGWDIGGAHVKACLWADGAVRAVVQWPCPLWQGTDRLDAVLAEALSAWPAMADAGTVHAVTMTGEMVDAFSNRADGVARIAERLDITLAGPVVCFGGDAGWLGPDAVAAHWADIASANWLATARHAAGRVRQGVLVDIGSTTTDLIAIRDGQVATRARSDFGRLATGELVYQGVVRTPLCAVAQRLPFRGTEVGVMNEWFATTADAYRLLGELVAAHDQHPTADGAAKDDAATRQRLARMIGLDAVDGTAADWLAVAAAWRAAQVDAWLIALRRVLTLHGLDGPDTVLVAAGCGDFVVPALAASLGLGCCRYADAVTGPDAPLDAEIAAWTQVCAPSVAVAMLYREDHLA